MSVNGKFKNFTFADFMAVADRFGIGEATNVIETVGKALKKWSSIAKKAGVSKKVAGHIKTQLLDVALTKKITDDSGS